VNSALPVVLSHPHFVFDIALESSGEGANPEEVQAVRTDLSQ
jgi:hypothetical protein